MLFVYDLAKSRSNRLEHGIDFAEAQMLWEDPQLLERQARTEDEPRYKLVGRIDETVWTAIVTYRGDMIRIISARRARSDERQAYFGG